MKTTYLKLIFTFLFVISISTVFAQREQNEEKEPNERGQQNDEPKEGRDFGAIAPSIEVLLNQPRVEPITISNIKPRWLCPFLYTKRMDGTYSFSELVVTNFSNKAVNYKLIFYNQEGKVVKTYSEQLKGKALRYLRLNWSFFEQKEFTGSVELQADSPALFPTARFQEDAEAEFWDQHQYFQYNYDWDWYKLD